MVGEPRVQELVGDDVLALVEVTYPRWIGEEGVGCLGAFDDRHPTMLARQG